VRQDRPDATDESLEQGVQGQCAEPGDEQVHRELDLAPHEQEHRAGTDRDEPEQERPTTERGDRAKDPDQGGVRSDRVVDGDREAAVQSVQRCPLETDKHHENREPDPGHRRPRRARP
jgi:hypothetical protein